MRRYETLFIVAPDCSEEDFSSIGDKFTGIIGSMNGVLIEYKDQGMKKLAYDIRKYGKGHYVLMEYAGLPELVNELERNMRLDDKILKYITVKLADEVDLEEFKAAAPEPEPEKEKVDSTTGTAAAKETAAAAGEEEQEQAGAESDEGAAEEVQEAVASSGSEKAS
ncbi:MAG: 30S ribosomal protein S6 [Deltaproteobacteria bacterium]|nr:30S ribosomal protein S6 [Deltaproteobacteria bacterium]MBW2072422.1 30S ribosomal protein S6 [Deltaproteobacteria bacterium]